MPRFSRRQLLKSSLISTALTALPTRLLAASRPKLMVPPLIDVRRGRPIVLTMAEMGYNLDGSHLVSVWAII